jgi:N-acylneuraminate cytidylyltransferase
LPQKNLRLLGGKPLVVRAVEAALGSRWIDRIVVSTDDEQIAAVARAAGGDVPFLRPAELATDSAPEWKAWQHAFREVQKQPGAAPVDLFVSVPATAGLRTSADIDRAIDRAIETGADIVITVTEAPCNPYFSMVVCDDAGYARLFAEGARECIRRQDAPKVYQIIPAVYVVRPEFLLRVDGYFGGRIATVELPRERSVDVDSEFDLQFAEFLLQRAAPLNAAPLNTAPLDRAA